MPHQALDRALGLLEALLGGVDETVLRLLDPLGDLAQQRVEISPLVRAAPFHPKAQGLVLGEPVDLLRVHAVAHVELEPVVVVLVLLLEIDHEGAIVPDVVVLPVVDPPPALRRAPPAAEAGPRFPVGPVELLAGDAADEAELLEGGHVLLGRHAELRKRVDDDAEDDVEEDDEDDPEVKGVDGHAPGGRPGHVRHHVAEPAAIPHPVVHVAQEAAQQGLAVVEGLVALEVEAEGEEVEGGEDVDAKDQEHPGRRELGAGLVHGHEHVGRGARLDHDVEQQKGAQRRVGAHDQEAGHRVAHVVEGGREAVADRVPDGGQDVAHQDEDGGVHGNAEGCQGARGQGHGLVELGLGDHHEEEHEGEDGHGDLEVVQHADHVEGHLGEARQLPRVLGQGRLPVPRALGVRVDPVHGREAEAHALLRVPVLVPEDEHHVDEEGQPEAQPGGAVLVLPGEDDLDPHLAQVLLPLELGVDVVDPGHEVDELVVHVGPVHVLDQVLLGRLADERAELGHVEEAALEFAVPDDLDAHHLSLKHVLEAHHHPVLLKHRVVVAEHLQQHEDLGLELLLLLLELLLVLLLLFLLLVVPALQRLAAQSPLHRHRALFRFARGQRLRAAPLRPRPAADPFEAGEVVTEAAARLGQHARHGELHVADEHVQVHDPHDLLVQVVGA
mmetsp:Transcript_12176/g.28528  ORF Transcript_12176/g.28528 Transcript_12176/m.28528 type:complete len:670 (-) Transcript_12176:885-2894(-)